MAKGRLKENPWNRFDLKIEKNWPIGSFRVTLEYVNYEMKVFINCGDCEETHYQRYPGIVRMNSGPICRHHINAVNSNRLLTSDVKKRLISMGCTVAEDFKYVNAKTPLEGVSFYGRSIDGCFDLLLTNYNKNGIPVGIANASSDDVWLGFVCHFASEDFEFGAFPQCLNRGSFDGFDPRFNRAYNFHGMYWHSQAKVINRDERTRQLAKINKIDYLEIYEKTCPKDKFLRAEIVLNFMYPNNTTNVLLKLKDLELSGGLWREMWAWCDSTGIFNRKNYNARKVINYLNENGLPHTKSPIYSRLKKAQNIKSHYFSQEVLDLVLKLRALKSDVKSLKIFQPKRKFQDELGRIYDTQKEAGAFLGCHPTHIGAILRKCRKSTAGHTFNYI